MTASAPSSAAAGGASRVGERQACVSTAPRMVRARSASRLTATGSSPRAWSAPTTSRPMVPVAPVTTTRIRTHSGRGASRAGRPAAGPGRPSRRRRGRVRCRRRCRSRRRGWAHRARRPRMAATRRPAASRLSGVVTVTPTARTRGNRCTHSTNDWVGTLAPRSMTMKPPARRRSAASAVGMACISPSGAPSTTIPSRRPGRRKSGPVRPISRCMMVVAQCSSATESSPRSQRSPMRRRAGRAPSCTGRTATCRRRESYCTSDQAPSSSPATRRSTSSGTRRPWAVWPRPGGVAVPRSSRRSTSAAATTHSPSRLVRGKPTGADVAVRGHVVDVEAFAGIGEAQLSGDRAASGAGEAGRSGHLVLNISTSRRSASQGAPAGHAVALEPAVV